MKLPGFRTSMYLGFALCLACLCSPFGWGVTHHPYPWANILLSFSYYGMVILAGIRLIQSLWRSSVPANGLLLALGVVLLIAAAFFGGQSLLFQLSTSRAGHLEVFLCVLAALTGMVLLKAIEERPAKRGRPVGETNSDPAPHDDPPS